MAGPAPAADRGGEPPVTYTATEAEVDEARAGGQAAAARRDGSPEDVPYRLLGAEDRGRATGAGEAVVHGLQPGPARQREQDQEAR